MDHKQLDVWKLSIDLTIEIYEISTQFPKEEIYALTQQIRRAATSVPSNIAEGAARKYNKEFIQFLHIALGSLAEVETQLIISKKLKYIDNLLTVEKRITSLRKLILGLIRYLNGE